jgi:hypothetical protein
MNCYVDWYKYTHFSMKVINSVYHVAGYVHGIETFILKII